MPQTEAHLFVPNNVAGDAVGYVANNAGTRMSPPPPTMESIIPAKKDATEMSIDSMSGVKTAR